MVSGAITIVTLFCVFGSIVYFVLGQIRKRAIPSDVEKIINGSEQLNAPCIIQITRDSSEDTDRVRKMEYAFSFNNGVKQTINDGSMIEFTTNIKKNALVGYGRGTYGGLSTHPSLDSPFIVEAFDGGIVKLIAKPIFDYQGGKALWKNNLNVMDREKIARDELS